MEILMAAGVPRRREGGVAAVIYNLGRELEKLGHRVSYLFYEDLLSGAEMAGRFRDVYFTSRLARHIRKNRTRYAVVNLHAPVGFGYGLLRALSPSDGYPPYVMTLHGLEERRIHAMQREVKKGRAWHFSFKNRLWHRIYHQPRYDLCIKTADCVHCFSRDVWTILQLKYNLDANKVAYIPNGVEERFFIKREYASRAPVRLLYAGTWLDQRGIFYLRDALNALNINYRDWTFSIAGPGVPEKEVTAFFGEPLRAQIFVIPAVPAECMPQLYADHDIFVFPSLMEGLPSVLLEAMASGMPVITAETCGMVDVVEDGWDGFLVPPADSEALEEALLRLCRCVELRSQLGKAAQESMRRYTWQKSAGKLERVFTTVLGNGATAGKG
jgi:glycosyltransferase involved in cell wall biosynthesis